MSARRRPIGVFDSGVGGLTVFKALRRRLPRESLTYFGDTANVPYGTKSPQAVTRHALDAGRFLEREGIKLLVVACNTASAVALKALQAGLKVPVVGVIEPGVRAAAAGRGPGGGPVGVIATEATIESGAYARALRRLLPRAAVRGAACPLFVPLVEEGWWSHAVARAVAAEYLAPLKRQGVGTLILGCTHYPMLKGVLKTVLGPGVRLVDSAETVALEVERLLAARGLLSSSGRPRYRFHASDGPRRFLRLARRFLGSGVRRVRIERFE